MLVYIPKVVVNFFESRTLVVLGRKLALLESTLTQHSVLYV